MTGKACLIFKAEKTGSTSRRPFLLADGRQGRGVLEWEKDEIEGRPPGRAARKEDSMDKKKMGIRVATAQDAAALLDIYRPYVEETAVSFEYETPSVQAFAERVAAISGKYPFLAAEQDGRLLGYACATAFKERAAYDWAVETTVYVRREARGTGVGRGLYEALETCLAAQNILNLNACIAVPEGEDPYLSMDSVAFHTRLGYRSVGVFHQCGCKFDRWYNMLWMEKHIGVHQKNQPSVKAFAAVREALRAQYGPG